MEKIEELIARVHVFLTLQLDGDENSASCPFALPLGENHTTPLERRLGGSTACLGAVGEREIVASIGAVQLQGSRIPSWGQSDLDVKLTAHRLAVVSSGMSVDLCTSFIFLHSVDWEKCNFLPLNKAYTIPNTKRCVQNLRPMFCHFIFV